MSNRTEHWMQEKSRTIGPKIRSNQPHGWLRHRSACLAPPPWLRPGWTRQRSWIKISTHSKLGTHLFFYFVSINMLVSNLVHGLDQARVWERGGGKVGGNPFFGRFPFPPFSPFFSSLPRLLNTPLPGLSGGLARPVNLRSSIDGNLLGSLFEVKPVPEDAFL